MTNLLTAVPVSPATIVSTLTAAQAVQAWYDAHITVPTECELSEWADNDEYYTQVSHDTQVASANADYLRADLEHAGIKAQVVMSSNGYDILVRVSEGFVEYSECDMETWEYYEQYDLPGAADLDTVEAAMTMSPDSWGKWCVS